MTGLVDLTGNTVPSEQDINNWMQAQILAGCGGMPNWMFTMQKLVGACVGTLLQDQELSYQLTQDEMVEVAEFAAIARAAQVAGREERRKRDLLIRVLEIEKSDEPPLMTHDSQDVWDLWTTRATSRLAATTTEEDDAS